jgi:hypothetical protein
MSEESAPLEGNNGAEASKAWGGTETIMDDKDEQLALYQTLDSFL